MNQKPIDREIPNSYAQVVVHLQGLLSQASGALSQMSADYDAAIGRIQWLERRVQDLEAPKKSPARVPAPKKNKG